MRPAGRSRGWRALAGPAAVMLATLPAAAAAAEATDASQGAAVYGQVCVACHQEGGVGAPGLAPPLVGGLAQRAARPEGRRYLLGVLLHGLSGRIVVQGQAYQGVMPPQAALDDASIAAVLNHVLVTLDAGTTQPAAVPFTAAEVAAARADTLSAKDLRALREQQP